MQLFRIANIPFSATGVECHSGLCEFVSNCESIEAKVKPDLELHADDSGLKLIWNRQVGLSDSFESLSFYIDVKKFVKRQRSYPAPKQGAFNQALGKKSRYIIDATGGWGGDALLMCAQGYRVTLIERQPIMALLLNDAMQRLSQTEWVFENDVFVPTVKQGDAIQMLELLAPKADCIYLDPMFPAKKKKSAAANKNMQLLQWLVGEDLDADALVKTALLGKAIRVAVKRPDYAAPLLEKPSTQFSSKLVHYDVYLRS